MCWRKLSCLFEVGKVRSSRVARSPPFLVPKGGFVSTTSKFFRFLPSGERVSPRVMGASMPWSMAFMRARRWVSWTSSTPVNAFWISNYTSNLKIQIRLSDKRTSLLKVSPL